MSREAASREVRRAVDATGLTRLDFAERAKVDPGTLSDFLEGRRWPQAPTRRKIEQALGWPAGRIGDIERDATGLPQQRAMSLEEAIEAETDLHPVAKAHLLNQLEILRHVPRDAPIQSREQEQRRDEARVQQQGRAMLEAVPTEPPAQKRTNTPGKASKPKR